MLLETIILADSAILYAVKGFFMRFEDDSIESAKIVKQWNVKIISVSIFFSLLPFYSCVLF